MESSPKELSGSRVVIIYGPHAGQEGICLGRAADGKNWAISPDDSNEVLSLAFEKEFALVLDMSGNPKSN